MQNGDLIRCFSFQRTIINEHPPGWEICYQPAMENMSKGWWYSSVEDAKRSIKENC